MNQVVTQNSSGSRSEVKGYEQTGIKGRLWLNKLNGKVL